MNKPVIFNLISWRDNASWLSLSWRLLTRHFGQVMLISGGGVFLFSLLIMLALQITTTNYLAIIITSLMLNLILPLVLTSLAAFVCRQPPAKASHCWRQALGWQSLRLTGCYLLIELAFLLASQLLSSQMPALAGILNSLRIILLALLQITAMVAFAVNMQSLTALPPFHLLVSSLLNLGRNWLACLILALTGILGLVAVLTISIPLAHIIGGHAALGLYVALLWLLVTWFGLAVAAMVKQMLAAAAS